MALLLAATISFLLYLLFNSRLLLLRLFRLCWRAREICRRTPGPPSIPILGSAHLFKWNVLKFTYQVEAWGRKYMMDNPEKSHGLMHIWVGPVPLVICGTHESIKPILDSNSLITKPSQYDILEKWLGKGILISTGDRWFNKRKLLTPAFHFNILRRYIPVFGEQGEILTNILQERADTGEIVDVFPLIKRAGLDIIAETAMGIRLGTQNYRNSEYINSVIRISAIAWDYQRFIWLWLSPIWYLSGYAADFEKHRKIATDFTRKVIVQRREILEEEGLLEEGFTEEQVRNKKLALLDHLILMQKANGLSDEDMRSEVDTFMFEGSDTNSSNMGFTLWFLGQNPSEQERVHEEMDRIFGTDDRSPTEDDLCKLVFLERCIKESLRLMPPVPIIARRLSHDVVVGDKILPEGITCIISSLSAQRDPRCWDHPEDFYPDHFLPEKQASRNAFTYIPFSAGPRNCIGQKFAMLEAKSLLAQIFRKFGVETVDSVDENRPLPEIILKPSKGFRVRLYTRQR